MKLEGTAQRANQGRNRSMPNIYIYMENEKITLTPSGAGKLEEIRTRDTNNILGSTR